MFCADILTLLNPWIVELPYSRNESNVKRNGGCEDSTAPERLLCTHADSNDEVSAGQFLFAVEV